MPDQVNGGEARLFKRVIVEDEIPTLNLMKRVIGQVPHFTDHRRVYKLA